jgi:hypothetical protein
VLVLDSDHLTELGFRSLPGQRFWIKHSGIRHQDEGMKTLTITITGGKERTVYRTSAERWTDFVRMERVLGPPMAGFDEDLCEQMRWHSLRMRVFIEDSGHDFQEQEEGEFLGGEER